MKYLPSDFYLGDVIVWSWEDENVRETNICVVKEIREFSIVVDQIYQDYNNSAMEYEIFDLHLGGHHEYLTIHEVNRDIPSPSLENITKIYPEYII